MIEYWARRPAPINIAGGAAVIGGTLVVILGVTPVADALGVDILWIPALWYIALFAAIALTTRYLDKLPLAWAGLGLHRWLPRELLLGALLGLGMATIAVLPALLFGEVSPGAIASPGILLSTAALIAINAAGEELAFRGYLFHRVVELIGPVAATLVISALFAAAHLANPDIGATGLINIFLAGIFFSFCYLQTGSLWLPMAAHVLWNGTLALLYGVPVSGIDFGPALLRVTLGERALVTGGAFGPEGGLAATAALVVGVLVIARANAVCVSPYTYATVFWAFHSAQRTERLDREPNRQQQP